MGAVGDFIGESIEMAGYALEEACDTARYTASDIFGSSSGGGVSSSSRLSASVHDLMIANELAAMREKMEKRSTEWENRRLEEITQSMGHFMKEIESLNKDKFCGESLRIDVEAIAKKNEALKKRLVGCMSNVMKARLVQEDEELHVILKERDDKKRNKEFDAFVERIQRQAIEKFKKRAEQTVKAQSDVISAEIKTRQKEVSGRLEESMKEYAEVIAAQANNEKLQQKQLGFMYESALCDCLLREAGALPWEGKGA